MRTRRILGIIAPILGLSACEKTPEDQLAVIRGQAYLIPWQDRPEISSVGPEIYVRLKRKMVDDRELMLIYDPRSLLINTNIGAPSLLGVGGDNEEDIIKDLKRFKIADGIVFCDKGLFGQNFHFTCGFRVQDGPVSWSVNFDENQIESASLIRTEAKRALRSYREAANAK